MGSALIVQPSLQTARRGTGFEDEPAGRLADQSFTEDGGLISYAAVLRSNTGWPPLM